MQGPTCRSNLRGATCAEQLAQCNLRRATCADQLAPTSLRRAPCLVLSRACFTKCREKERILQRWADLACDVLLSGQPWSSLSLYAGVCIMTRGPPRENPKVNSSRQNTYTHKTNVCFLVVSRTKHIQNWVPSKPTHTHAHIHTVHLGGSVFQGPPPQCRSSFWFPFTTTTKLAPTNTHTFVGVIFWGNPLLFGTPTTARPL